MRINFFIPAVNEMQFKDNIYFWFGCFIVTAVILPGLKVFCLDDLAKTFITFLVIFFFASFGFFFPINFTITFAFQCWDGHINSQKLKRRPTLASKEHEKHWGYFPCIQIPNAFFFSFCSSCLTEEGQLCMDNQQPQQHIQPTVGSLLQERVFLRTCHCHTPVQYQWLTVGRLARLGEVSVTGNAS